MNRKIWGSRSPDELYLADIFRLTDEESCNTNFCWYHIDRLRVDFTSAAKENQ